MSRIAMTVGSTMTFLKMSSIAFESVAEHSFGGQAGRQILVDICLGGRLRSSGKEISVLSEFRGFLDG